MGKAENEYQDSEFLRYMHNQLGIDAKDLKDAREAENKKNNEGQTGQKPVDEPKVSVKKE